MANTTPMQMYVENGDLITEYAMDSSKVADEIYALLYKALGTAFTKINFKKGQKIATGYYTCKDNHKVYFLVANVTFMGARRDNIARI